MKILPKNFQVACGAVVSVGACARRQKRGGGNGHAASSPEILLGTDDRVHV